MEARFANHAYPAIAAQSMMPVTASAQPHCSDGAVLNSARPLDAHQALPHANTTTHTTMAGPLTRYAHRTRLIFILANRETSWIWSSN